MGVPFFPDFFGFNGVDFWVFPTFFLLLRSATKVQNEHKKIIHDFSDFIPALDKKNVILAPFCGDKTCEDKIKKESTR